MAKKAAKESKRAHQEMEEALKCLYLMVPEEVAKDVGERVLARVVELEGALEDAIGAIKHSCHPVSMEWIPSLNKKLARL